MNPDAQLTQFTHGASELRETLTPRLLSPAFCSGRLAANVWPFVRRRCVSSPMRRTCADRNQNRLPQQLWHRGLLEQWGLSYLRFGEEFRRANHGHVKVVVSAILKDRLLERGVRKMRAVPRQQIIHPMNNGEGNMRRIHLRLRRQLQKCTMESASG